MSRGIAAFAILAFVLAAIFVRLGVWQLDRLAERRAENAQRIARLSEPESDALVLARSTGGWLRKAFVEGTPDYDNEFVVTGRSRNGSPGVHIFTPLVVAGDSRRFLVNRGWVYSPDAATVDLARWREKRTTFHGYTSQFPFPRTAPQVKGRSTRTFNHAAVRALLPYDFHPLYLVVRDSGDPAAPARLPDPDLSEGPHLNYAIQWFSFAAIALVGAGIVIRRDRRRRQTPDARAQGLP